MDQNERLREQIGTLLRLFLVNERAFPSAEGRARYNPLDFQTLGWLARWGPSRPGDMADGFGIAPTTMSSVADRLQKRGLIRREADPADGRARRLALTEEGQDLFAAIYRQDLRNMDVMLGALSADERESLLALMDRVVARVEEMAIRTAGERGRD